MIAVDASLVSLWDGLKEDFKGTFITAASKLHRFESEDSLLSQEPYIKLPTKEWQSWIQKPSNELAAENIRKSTRLCSRWANGEKKKKGQTESPPVWWRIPDSNRSPHRCQRCALPDELIPREN